MPNRKIKTRRGYTRPQNSYPQMAAGALGAPHLDETPAGLLRREYAWREAKITSEVIVPVSLSAGYAIIGASAGALLARAGGHDPATAATIGALLTGATAYAVITKRQLQSLWAVEEYGEETETETPIVTPAPAPPPRPDPYILINPYRGQQAQQQNTQDQERSKMIQFIRRCEMSGTSWTTHQPFLDNRAEWDLMRNKLIAAGYAAWNNPHSKQQGWTLTAPAAEAIAGIID